MLYEVITLTPAAEADFTKLNGAVNDFVTFRTETVRQAREGGGAAANAYGNNDENRANRKALNTEVETRRERITAQMEAVNDELSGFYATLVSILGVV